MRKRRFQFFVWYVGTTQKWTDAILKLLLDQPLKNASKRESSKYAELEAVYMVIDFVWRMIEKMFDCSLLSGCIQWIDWMVRNLGRMWFEYWWERHLEKKYVHLSKWSKDMNILVFHTNVHKNVSSSEEFNNQIDKITHSLDSSPVFQPLLTLPNGPPPKKKGHDQQ